MIQKEDHSSLLFDFYGIVVEILSPPEVVKKNLRRDFEYFLKPAGRSSRIRITCHESPFPQEELPLVPSSSISPRCYTFNEGAVRWVNYYKGKCLTRWDFLSESGEVWGVDLELMYEVCYLLILSRAGENLDRLGIHRLHASAISIEGRAGLIVMPSGGGKSTLAVGAMAIAGAEFISDDMPLIRRNGEVLAFPSRLGFHEPPKGMLLENTRQVFRREHGDKWLVDASIFQGRVSEKAEPRLLLFGSRKLKGAPRIRSMSRMRAFCNLMGPLIVGVGLPQLIEYFLRWSWRDVFNKMRLVASRTFCAISLARHSVAFYLELGASTEENIEFVNKTMMQYLSHKSQSFSEERIQ